MRRDNTRRGRFLLCDFTVVRNGIAFLFLFTFFLDNACGGGYLLCDFIVIWNGIVLLLCCFLVFLTILAISLIPLSNTNDTMRTLTDTTPTYDLQSSHDINRLYQYLQTTPPSSLTVILVPAPATPPLRILIHDSTLHFLRSNSLIPTLLLIVVSPGNDHTPAYQQRRARAPRRRQLLAKHHRAKQCRRLNSPCISLPPSPSPPKSPHPGGQQRTIKLAAVLTTLTLVALSPRFSAAVKNVHMTALNSKFNPKNAARTTGSTNGCVEMCPASELVRLVVVSFANSPLVAAHSPERIERWSQLKAIVARGDAVVDAVVVREWAGETQ